MFLLLVRLVQSHEDQRDHRRQRISHCNARRCSNMTPLNSITPLKNTTPPNSTMPSCASKSVVHIRGQRVAQISSRMSVGENAVERVAGGVELTFQHASTAHGPRLRHQRMAYLFWWKLQVARPGGGDVTGTLSMLQGQECNRWPVFMLTTLIQCPPLVPR